MAFGSSGDSTKCLTWSFGTRTFSVGLGSTFLDQGCCPRVCIIKKDTDVHQRNCQEYSMIYCIIILHPIDHCMYQNNKGIYTVYKYIYIIYIIKYVIRMFILGLTLCSGWSRWKCRWRWCRSCRGLFGPRWWAEFLRCLGPKSRLPQEIPDVG